MGSDMYPFLFGIILVALGILNFYIHGEIIYPIVIFGFVFVAISIIHFFYDRHNKDTNKKLDKYFKKEKNNKDKLKSLQPKIDKYNDFIRNVCLCTRHTISKKTTNYVCIHKETKELFCFRSKVVGSQGRSDVCCFYNDYHKITSYSQLISNLDSTSKLFFADLNQSNWKNYFEFMLESPNVDGEIIKKQLLSSDKYVVRKAVFAVIDLVLGPPKKRKAFLSASYENLSLIKENTKGIDMGGIFAPGDRFLSRAIQIIEGNFSEKCFCRLAIDEFGPSANGLAKKGFILVQPDESINAYSRRGIIECPVCHKRYSITEEYTGWHIPTIIHCTEILSSGDAVNNEDSVVKH